MKFSCNCIDGEHKICTDNGHRNGIEKEWKKEMMSPALLRYLPASAMAQRKSTGHVACGA